MIFRFIYRFKARNKTKNKIFKFRKKKKIKFCYKNLIWCGAGSKRERDRKAKNIYIVYLIRTKN